MTARLHAVVHGRVQGVGFRIATVERARQLRLTGWVRNLPDDTVETVAVGPRESLEAFAMWLHSGPLGARVTKVDLAWSDAGVPFRAFEIRYDSD